MPGNFPGTLPARLAEPLPQCRGGPARSLRIRTAHAAAGSGFCANGCVSVLKAFDAYMNEKDTWASQHAPHLSAKSGRLLFGRVRLSRNAAHRGRRAGHSGGRPREVRQRPRTRLCRHQPVLPRRLFPAGDRSRKLADGILHAAEPQEPAARTGARRERGTAGLPCGNRHDPGVISRPGESTSVAARSTCWMPIGRKTSSISAI